MAISKIPLVDLKSQYKPFADKLARSIKKIVLQSSFRYGEEVYKFEEEFARYCNTKYCVGLGSGYDAVLLSLEAIGVSPGDEVITVPNTFISTVTPIIRLGAKPVFVDVDPTTYQIDPRKIEQVITKKTKVILPVHLYGIPAPMDAIIKIAKKHSLYIIEDACQAHGSIFQGKKCGSLGDAATFSFYPAKNLGTSGEAGAVVTNNKKIAEKIKLLSNMGESTRYKHEIIGYNSHLDTIDAAILLSNLRMLDKWNQKRKRIARLYDTELKDLPVITPPAPDDKNRGNYWVYVIRTKYRNQLFKFLKNKGISCGIHYPIPLHLQKALSLLKYKKGDFPVTEKLSQEIVSLPIYPMLNSQQQNYIVKSVGEFFSKKRR